MKNIFFKLVFGRQTFKLGSVRRSPGLNVLKGNHRLLLLLLQTLSQMRELPAPCVRSRCAEEAWSGPDAHRAQRGRGEELTEPSGDRRRSESQGCALSPTLTAVSSLQPRTPKRKTRSNVAPFQTHLSGLIRRQTWVADGWARRRRGHWPLAPSFVWGSC